MALRDMPDAPPFLPLWGPERTLVRTPLHLAARLRHPHRPSDDPAFEVLVRHVLLARLLASRLMAKSARGRVSNHAAATDDGPSASSKMLWDATASVSKQRHVTLSDP